MEELTQAIRATLAAKADRMSQHDEVTMELQARMSKLRNRISASSEQLAGQTRAALSWRHQVASHPLAVAAVAIAVGYWMVPALRRSGAVSELKSIGNMMEQKLAAIKSNGAPAAASNPSPLMVIGRSAAAAGASFLLRHLAGSVMEKAAVAFDGYRRQGPPNGSDGAVVAIGRGGLDD